MKPRRWAWLLCLIPLAAYAQTQSASGVADVGIAAGALLLALGVIQLVSEILKRYGVVGGGSGPKETPTDTQQLATLVAKIDAVSSTLSTLGQTVAATNEIVKMHNRLLCDPDKGNMSFTTRLELVEANQAAALQAAAILKRLETVLQRIEPDTGRVTPVRPGSDGGSE